MYQADGHSSSSAAYEKGNHLCNIHVNIDSSCDDEETGPFSEFWFEIYCEKTMPFPDGISFALEF